MSMQLDLLQTSQTSVASRIMAGLAHAFRVAVAVKRSIGHRRDVRILLEFDDRALKDIGLVRSDVLGALAEPLIRDPSRTLSIRSDERRARSRGLDDVTARRSRRADRL